MDIPLDSIQGNVLKAFMRAYSVHFLIRFTDDAHLKRSEIRELLLRYVTSAQKQDEVTDYWKNHPAEPQEVVGMVALSFTGYRRLKLEGSVPVDLTDAEDPFLNGMAHSKSEYLWKPETDLWEPAYAKQEIDALVVLTNDLPGALSKRADQFEAELRGLATVVAKECGRALTRDEKPVDHFGFREGISRVANPELMFRSDSPDGGEPGFGCFVAFAKIEQNVAEFQRHSQLLADQANSLAGTEPAVTGEQVQELAIGRRFNGDPLAPFNAPDQDAFTFAGVSHSVCPFHAHIRAVNGRNSAEMPRLVRRGMSYGPRPDLDEPGAGHQPPTSGAGLLFMCFQSETYDFGMLMGRAKKLRDPTLVRDVDWKPGTNAQSWSLRGQDVPYRMSDLTTVRGGGYFFLPSMTFIRSLK